MTFNLELDVVQGAERSFPLRLIDDVETVCFRGLIRQISRWSKARTDGFPMGSVLSIVCQEV